MGTGFASLYSIIHSTSMAGMSPSHETSVLSLAYCVYKPTGYQTRSYLEPLLKITNNVLTQ